MHPLIEQNREHILRLAQAHHIASVYLFGSFVRGEETAKSDVDLLVQPDKNAGGFDLARFLMDVQALLHRKVDVVTERALHPLIRERVMQEAKRL